MYGLGSYDMKCGLACAVAAFKALYEARFNTHRGRRIYPSTDLGLGIGAIALADTLLLLLLL